ncbi:hypothetical protein D1871_20545 [Nakamurella silvestris]|nr:hypothetical protein D1871_20545 [Nakamurella silvestris]
MVGEMRRSWWVWGLGCLLLCGPLPAGCVADPVRGSRVEDLTAAGTGGLSGSVVETSDELTASAPDVSTPVSTLVPPTSDSVSSSTSSAPRTTAHPADPEAEARRDIEKVWRTYWRIYTTSTAMTPEDLKSAISAVAVDPIRTDVIKQAQYFHDKGLEKYGSAQNHPSFSGSGGSHTLGIQDSKAYLGDCLDLSGFGSRYVSTGKKRTVGLKQDHVVGEFTKGSGSVWKLRQIYFLADPTCAS